MKRPDIDVSFGACFMAASGILILPMDWLLAAIAAAAIHEAGHLIALRILGIPVHQIRVGCFGSKITTGFMSVIDEFICAAAGPAFSFGTVLLTRWFPLLGLIAMAQGLFNLIPIFPMDGGRIFGAMIELLRKYRRKRKIPCKRRQ